MSKIKVSIKVYFDKDNVVYKRLELLSNKTGLSVSTVGSMALHQGIETTENILKKLIEGSKPKRRKKSVTN